MLNPDYRKVNVGLAWDRNTSKAIQHFEGDFIEPNHLSPDDQADKPVTGTSSVTGEELTCGRPAD